MIMNHETSTKKTTYAYTIDVALYRAPQCGCERTLKLFVIQPPTEELPTISTHQDIFNVAVDAIHSFDLPLFNYYEQASLKAGILSEWSDLPDKPDYEKNGWRVYWTNNNP